MNKLVAILFIYLGSVCYTIASFWHLSLGDKWSFSRAYPIAIMFVCIEYIFNVLGNKNANRHLTVFQIMLLIIGFDLINLFIINLLLLKNKIDVMRDGISLLLRIIAIFISSKSYQIQK